jgi:hypothetical protein
MSGSVAMATRYVFAQGTGAHVSLSGEKGWLTSSPPTGARRTGSATQAFSIDRATDQRDTAPALVTARTCHQ